MGLSLKNSCPVFSCCFSHAISIFSGNATYILSCGWSWTLLSALITQGPSPHPRPYGACSSAALTWEHAYRICPWNMLPASQPWGRQAKEPEAAESWGAGHLGLDSQFWEVTFGKPPLYLTLHSTCLPPSLGLPGASLEVPVSSRYSSHHLVLQSSAGSDCLRLVLE